MATYLPIRIGAHGSVGPDASPAHATPGASARSPSGASLATRAAAVVTWLIATAASFLPVLVVAQLGLILALA